jgi:predicted dehydrogenase
MEAKEKIKIAVIGVGIMGSAHLLDITNLENTQLAAICDINRERADQASEEYRCQPITTTMTCWINVILML